MLVHLYFGLLPKRGRHERVARLSGLCLFSSAGTLVAVILDLLLGYLGFVLVEPIVGWAEKFTGSWACL